MGAVVTVCSSGDTYSVAFSCPRSTKNSEERSDVATRPALRSSSLPFMALGNYAALAQDGERERSVAIYFSRKSEDAKRLEQQGAKKRERWQV